MTKEIVICAAIQMENGYIIRGHRHGDCIAAAIVRRYPHVGKANQGFMTSRNRFVDRQEARRLQEEAAIPSAAAGGYRLDILFSEDLY